MGYSQSAGDEKNQTMRIILLLLLTSCGSIQTINGVRIPKDRPNIKTYVAVTAIGFGVGYYAGKNILPQKK